MRLGGECVLLFAADACQTLLRLRELIAQIGRIADRFENLCAMRLLLALKFGQAGGSTHHLVLTNREVLLGGGEIGCG